MPETNRNPENVGHVEKQLTSQMVNSLIRDIQIIKAIRLGEPGLEILKYAAANEMQLIVIGTHGCTGVSHLLIGSNAEKVIQRSTCPVLSVHSDSHQVLSEEQKAAEILSANWLAITQKQAGTSNRAIPRDSKMGQIGTFQITHLRRVHRDRFGGLGSPSSDFAVAS